MFKKACLCVMAVIFALLPSVLNAQAPDTLWTRRYNGPANGYDESEACMIDGWGNLYVTGYSSNGTNYDYLTVKYNISGDTLWTRRYNGPSNDMEGAYSCAVDGLGNLYVTGWSPNDPDADYLTIKYNELGDTIWTRWYNGPANGGDIARSCAVDSINNLYVVGYSSNGTDADYLTIKYKADGETLWTRRYNNPPYGAIATDCAVDCLGNLYVVGYSSNGTNDDYLTIKYNADGDTLWSRRYNGPANGGDRASGCAVDGLGNLYVVGQSHNGSNYDCLTIKYNTAGDTLWTCLFNGPFNGSDGASDCAVDGIDNIYVTGRSYNGINDDYLTIKYNDLGDTIWTCRYNGPANSNDYATGCVVDSSGNLYVTGYSYSNTNADYLTIKYNTATGVTGNPEPPIIGNKLRLEQNRPNPFNQHTTISYQLPTSGTASLKIYNAAGQLVKTFDMGQQQAGHHQVEWSDSKITAGVYFYRLTAGNYQATKKLVVVK